jgi:protein pelota
MAFSGESTCTYEAAMYSNTAARSADIATRRKYIALVEEVKKTGGKVYIFSSLHVSGERKLLAVSTAFVHNNKLTTELGNLTGVAAVLSYPLPDIETMELDQPATPAT